MKKFCLYVLTVLLIGTQTAFADADLSGAKLTGPAASYNNASAVQNRTDVSQCTDSFSISSEQLFYLTLGVLNKMNFKVEEVQSKTGTVLFKANSKEFLITISNKDLKNAFIKILPTDSNYAFSPMIVQNILSLLKENVGVQPINLI